MKRKGLRLKKVLAVMMVLCLAVGMLVVPGAGVVVKAAEEGELQYQDFTYKTRLGHDNEIEITGYQGNDTEIVIPNVIAGKTVSCIGVGAFQNCTGLKKVIIQEGVTRIDTSAFSGCTNLDSIIIPKTVTAIGNGTFHGCSSLSNITIPENVTILGDGVFANCSSLTSITIPEGVTELGCQAFDGCSSLNSIILPSSLISIDMYAFMDCKSLNSIVIPENVTDIGEWAFKDCSGLQNIILPSKLTNIAEYTFYGCSSLGSITIPEGVHSIGRLAFDGCGNLRSIVIPKGVNSIGGSAFRACSSLSSIELPEGITSIESGTFRGCSNLQSIVIPEAVESIGDDAFYECSSLSSIDIPKGVRNIGDCAFYQCSSLSNIELPEGIISIERGTFHGCSNLRSIIIPEKVSSIGASAFYECNSLSSIIIPKGVNSIGDYAFLRCSSLSNITISGVSSIGNNAFRGCGKLSNVMILEGVSNIGDSAFSECSSLTSIMIPEGISSVDNRAFFSCSQLKSITIPKSVIEMGEEVFHYCYGLNQITNNSAMVLDLTTINSRVQWYDTATGEPIDKLGTGTAIALPKPVIIKKSDVILGDGSQFVDKYGNKIDADNIVIVKSTITQEQQDIIHAVEEITQNVAEKSKVFYYDISAYINAMGGEPAILSGNITIRLDYPAGVTKDYDIVVLHNTSRLEDVKKYDNYFTFKTDGFSPFTIIALEADETPDADPVHDFVNRLYTLVLQRDASEDEVGSWTDALIGKRSNGVDAGYGFVFSDECKEKNLSNEDFVEILYNTFMNRPSDEGGKSAWVSQLDAGVEREKVFEGFIYSAEFADVCASYGINVGNTSDVGALVDALSRYRNRNADITKFVARCYTEAMGRTYEPDGLEAWCKVIIEKSNTPKQVAQNFIFSDEFTGKNLNNEEYVKVLYRTFMGREADEGGLAAWVEVLKSGHEDRAKVLEGFSDSAEFAEILQSFGLN